jgi:hypothetical protein
MGLDLGLFGACAGLFAGKPAPTVVLYCADDCGHTSINCGSGLAREGDLADANDN